MRKTVLLSLIFVGLLSVGIGGYFLTDMIINNYFSGNTELIFISMPLEKIKGDPVPITFEIELEGAPRTTIETLEIGISSDTYSLNGSVTYELNQEIERGSHIVVVEMGPLINASTGLFALNVGEYDVYSFKITFENRVPEISENVDFSLNITNQLEVEQIINGDFSDSLNNWQGDRQNDKTEIGIVTHPSFEGNCIRFTNIETIDPGNSTWISISQTVNLTKSHYLSFDQEIESTNSSIEVNLFTNGIKSNMSLNLDISSLQNQLIHFGEGIGMSNVTLQVVFVYADNSTHVYLDNLSILQYEHRVFVFMLNDNWEISGKEVARDNLFTTMHETSAFFEKELGIKLIPVVELPWHPEDVSMSVVDTIALQTAGDLLGLDGSWDVEFGRSPDNHGFDLLTSFSNQTSEHFGFAYYERNAAFHFAESGELGEYSWIGIVADWAENLVQHEIAHNFGAYDRDRTDDPPSVMSKPVTPQQVWDDFSHGELWLQVNNWMIEDILLMLQNRAMFD
ncbi:MAG: hypothetical protein GOP50_11275 [Candidatus Heimdallarchaeota archaeon]|nr:hypothetical protein [Candidatus Heimdallarchaeota archaeon]